MYSKVDSDKNAVESKTRFSYKARKGSQKLSVTTNDLKV